jgi:tetratricopeptide (TPR) repeat protein
VAVACDLFEESAALFQQIGDIHFLSFAREFLGHSWLHRGHPEEARIHYQEALAMRQYLNDHWSIGWALYNLGQAELAANNLEAAARCFEVSLARFENLGTQQGIVPELIRQIGMVARQTGDIRLAKARFLESLKRYQTIEGTSGIINCLVDLGRLEADQGQVVQGLRLLCAANRHIQTSGMETNLSLRDALDHARMVACSQLDVTAVEAECAAGRNLSLEQAIAAALSGTDPSTGSTASAH